MRLILILRLWFLLKVVRLCFACGHRLVLLGTRLSTIGADLLKSIDNEANGDQRR